MRLQCTHVHEIETDVEGNLHVQNNNHFNTNFSIIDSWIVNMSSLPTREKFECKVWVSRSIDLHVVVCLSFQSDDDIPFAHALCLNVPDW